VEQKKSATGQKAARIRAQIWNLHPLMNNRMKFADDLPWWIIFCYSFSIKLIFTAKLL
jgi:hypothetical protein